MKKNHSTASASPVEEVIDRIAHALNTGSPNGWMGRLGVRPETVRTWRKRGQVPPAQVLRASQISGRSVESITRGNGFFVQKEKQISSESHANIELLMTVLRVVLEALDEKGLELPAEKVTELVRLIYEHLATHHAALPEREIKATATRYLRLVA